LQPFFSQLGSKLPPSSVEFIKAIAAVLHDSTKLPDLDRFPAWREAGAEINRAAF
jgi:hypothetical protein